ncbi:MAG TPA: hypothetical protein VH914_19265 [Acidimicrobiia bacterium]|nr:hypothetical protein [Acidimicrobiia bacterium]
MRVGARLGCLVAGLLVILVVLFALPTRLPGGAEDSFLGGQRNDPIARLSLRADMHASRALPLRFVDFVGDVAGGDLGHSPVIGADVGAVVGERTVESLLFAAVALAVAWSLRRWRRTRSRRRATGAVPGVVVALPVLAALVVGARFGAMPFSAPHAALVSRAGASLLPALALGAGLAAWMAIGRRSTREVVAAVALGTIVTEAVFALPGLGSTFAQSTAGLDPMTTRGVFFAIAVAVLLALVVLPGVERGETNTGSLGGRAARGVVATAWVAAVVVAIAARLHLGLPAAARIGADGPSGSSGAHPFGTDAVGRDVLARVLATGRGSLLLVVAAVVIATVVGSVIGVVIGFAGGPLERIGVAALKGWAAFPGELVALVLLTFNGRSGARAAVALAFVAAPAIARGAQQRTLAAVQESDPDLATGAWVRSFGSHVSFGVVRATLATVFVAAGRVLAAEIIAGLLGVGPAATQTWSREIASQLPFAAHAPQAVAAPLLVALVTAAALAALGNAIRPSSPVALAAPPVDDR